MEAVFSMISKASFKSNYIYIATGIILYLAFQLSYICITQLSRCEPVEIDDTYSYILSSEILSNAPNFHCEAFQNLKEQLSRPSDNYQVSETKFRIYHRIFNIYTPLYSLILNAMNSFINSWYWSFLLMQIAGSIVICLGFTFFLNASFNAKTTGLALALIGSTMFAGQGLHYVVPSNISMGISLFSWWLILSREAPPKYILFALALLSIGTHKIGIIFQVISVFLLLAKDVYWPLNFQQLKKNAAIFLVLMTAILLSLVLYKYNFFLERFFSISDPTPPDWNYLIGVKNNISSIIFSLNVWLSLGNYKEPAYYIILINVFLLSVIGYTSLSANAKRNILTLLAIVIPLLFSDFILVYPTYPGMIAQRIFLIFSAIIFGCISMGLITLVEIALKLYKNKNHSKLSFDKTSINNLLLSGIIFSLVFSFASHFPLNKLRHIKYRTLSYIGRMNFNLDQKQVSYAKENTLSNEIIVYNNEIALYYYLTYGAWNNKTIVLPICSDEDLEKALTVTSSNLKFFVDYNKFKMNLYSSPKGILLKNNETLSLELSDQLDSNCMSFSFRGNPGEYDFTVINEPYNKQQISYKTYKITKKSKLSVPETVLLDNINCPVKIIIRAGKNRNRSFICRFSLSENQKTEWPWNRNIILKKDENQSFSLDLGFSFNNMNRELEVISDSGYLLLSEFK